MPKRKNKKRGKDRAAGLQKSMEQHLIDNIDNAPSTEIDPRFDERSLQIQEALAAQQGKLANLDPEAQADLDAIRANAQSQYEVGAGEREKQFARTMFGRGQDASSIMGNLGSQLLTNEALMSNQIGADAAQRSLGLRQFMGQQDLQNLGMQHGMMSDDRGAALNLLGLQQQGYLGQLNAAAGVASSYNSAAQQLRGAQAAASASRYGSDQSRIASMYGSDQALAGTRAMAGASRYGSDQSLRAALAAAGAQRYGHDMRFKGDRLDFRLGKQGLQQQNSHFGQQLGFNYYNADQQAALTREGYQNQLALGQMAQPSTTDRLFGLGAAFLGGAGANNLFKGLSDERLKKEISRIENAVEKVEGLRPVTWRWFDEDGVFGGGVIAQDLEKVMPTAVEMSEGYRHVDYHAVIGLLVGAVQELSSRLHDVEEEQEVMSV